MIFWKIKSSEPNKLKPDRSTFGGFFGGAHSLHNYRKAMFFYSYAICSIDALAIMTSGISRGTCQNRFLCHLSGCFHEARIVSYSYLVHRFEHFHSPPVFRYTQIAIGKMRFVQTFGRGGFIGDFIDNPICDEFIFVESTKMICLCTLHVLSVA